MRVRHLNLSNPDHSAALQAPLAKSEGGWELCTDEDGRPVFASKSDADYQQILSSLQKVTVCSPSAAMTNGPLAGGSAPR